MTTPPWHHACQLTLITSIEVNLASPSRQRAAACGTCRISGAFCCRALFLKHVLQRHMFYPCSSVSPACVWHRRSRSMQPEPRCSLCKHQHKARKWARTPPSFAFNSIYVWVWYPAQAAPVMYGIFNVRRERMWFEFGRGRSLLLWIELKFLHIWWSRAAELVWTGADYAAQLSDLVECAPWAMWSKLHFY